MVFKVCRDQCLGSGSFSILHQETSRTSTDSHFLNRLIGQRGMPNHLGFHSLLEKLKKSHFCHGLPEKANETCSHHWVWISTYSPQYAIDFQSEFVCNLFIDTIDQGIVKVGMNGIQDEFVFYCFFND